MNIFLLILKIYGVKSVRRFYHFFVIGFAINEYLLAIITFTRFVYKINVLAISACSTERFWHRADLNVCDIVN